MVHLTRCRGVIKLSLTTRAPRNSSSLRTPTTTLMAMPVQTRWVLISRCRNSSGIKHQGMHMRSTVTSSLRLSMRHTAPSSCLLTRSKQACPKIIRSHMPCTLLAPYTTLGKVRDSTQASTRLLRVKGITMATRCPRPRPLPLARSFGMSLLVTLRAS